MTAAAIDRTDLKPRGDRAARVLTTFVAGLLGASIMYSIWRGTLGIPLELSVPVHMSDTGSPVRPWAPIWVPQSIAAIVAMLLWRLIAARGRRISLLGGVLAFVAFTVLAYPIAHLCLDVGAIMQYNPPPPLSQIVPLIPLMIVGACMASVLQLMMNGIVMLPMAALLGLATAGFGRLILAVGRRFG